MRLSYTKRTLYQGSQVGFLLAISLALATCGPFPGSSRAKAHDAIKNLLFDPDSAQFRNEETASDGSVCGEVNSKNRMGGYVGFTRFVYVASMQSVMVSTGEPDFSEYYRDMENEYLRKDAGDKIVNACAFASEWKIFCPDNVKTAEDAAQRQCKMWTDGGDHEKALKAEIGADQN